MIATRTRRSVALAAAALALPVVLTACSNDKASDSAAGSSASAAASPAKTMASPMEGPFGPACGSVPKSGAGSFNGMAKDPVATAASHNPALATLVAAVTKAGLGDTLNNAKDITVFAPTNEAFAKIPKAQLDKVLADKAMLTKILTYHVVGQRVTPQEMTHGTFTTLEKGTLKTSGSGTSYTVNDSAKVVCGNVPTANATVYIVDSVLMPPAN